MKKALTGPFRLLILVPGLLAEASRRDVTAVSTDDPASYGIIVTRSSIEAAKEFVDNESAGSLLNFLISQNAGASPA